MIFWHWSLFCCKYNKY